MNSTAGPAHSGAPERGKIWIIAVTAAAVAALTLYQYLCWRTRPLLVFYLPLVLPHRWVTSSEMFHNLVRVFQRYTEGYLRTGAGYFIFGMMALAFAGAGRFILSRVLKLGGNFADFSSFHFLERLSLYPLLGSLAYSLLWLFLGSFGWLHPALAGAVLATGAVASLRTLDWRALGRLRSVLRETFDLRSWPEKVWIIFLGVVALGLSTFAVHPQSHVDVIFSTLGLPEFYAAWGRVRTYPYHIYSYMTQNTEMLALWAVVLKSEVAAALLVWGFFLALLAWTAGFFRRRVSGFTALLTVTLLMAAPVVVHQSIKLKTDIPVAVFLFVHFCALAEFMERRRQEDSQARSWLILAGLLGGGAVAYKLLAVPVVFCSTGLVVGSDFARRRSGGKGWDAPVWLLALALPCLPWLLRTFMATGNPFYPFLIDWFGSHRMKPWHGMRGEESFFELGGSGVARYFKFLSFEEKEPLWGPTFLFAFWSLEIWRSRKNFGWRWALAVAWVSWLALIPYAFQVRFHIGMFTFIICSAFALFWEETFQNVVSRFRRILILAPVALYFGFTYFYAQIWQMWMPSVAVAASGYSPGTFELNSLKLHNWLWLCHLINTRTEPNETFACLEMTAGYGLQRPYYFNFGHDKPLIQELAEQSQNPQELKDRLKSLGVQHLIIEAGFESMQQYFLMKPRDAAMVQGLLDQECVLRLTTPDQSLSWYTWKDSPSGSHLIEFGLRDAEAFPLLFSDQAEAIFFKDRSMAQRMITDVNQLRLPKGARVYTLYRLAMFYQNLGDRQKAESILRSAIGLAPGYWEGYFNLASYYQGEGPGSFPLAAENYRKALAINPTLVRAYANLDWISRRLEGDGRELKAPEAVRKDLAGPSAPMKP